MKKCHGCHKEIDKYAIACQYCGKLAEDKEQGEADTSPEEQSEEKKSEDQ